MYEVMDSVWDDMKVDWEVIVKTPGRKRGYRKLWRNGEKVMCRFGNPETGRVSEIKKIYALLGYGSEPWHSPQATIMPIERLSREVPSSIRGYRLYDSEDADPRKATEGCREVPSLTYLLSKDPLSVR